MAINPRNLAAAIVLVVLSATWGWWGAKEGAYFGTVFYPGLLLLCAGLVLASAKGAWPKPLALSTWARLAIVGLVGLGLWSALSASWSPSPDTAVADGQRILGYAVAFGLGLWLRVLLGPRANLAMAPVVAGALVAGVVAVGGLLTGSELSRYVDEGTLLYPLGYRNANAAFFLVALWPAVGLATNRTLDWRLRGLSLGTATLCLELAVLSQSRGSVLAAGIALIVFLVVAPGRARWTGWLFLAAVPAALVIPPMLDLYDAATRVGFEGTDELRSAGRAAAAGTALAVVLGCGAALIGRRRASSPARHARLDRAVAVGAIALAVAAVAGFAVATERPIGWIGDRFDEFLTQGTPEAGGASSRFSANAGSERDDLWRVALSDAGDDPILGLGGGGFQYSYLQDRSEEGIPSVRDAHSVELEVLSELGGPGLVLLGVALVGAIGGAVASMGARAESAALGAAALTAGTYWLAHASIDWFWAYPAVTAPVFALLGAACKVGPPAPEGAVPGRWRVAAVAGVVVLAVSLIPPFLSERYVDAAYGGWRADPERAWSDLERARDLNPLSIEPLLAEGGIARALGDRPRAIAAFEEAADERPEEWAAHYFIAELSQNVDPARARAAIERARELNPLSARVRALSRRVESASARP